MEIDQQNAENFVEGVTETEISVVRLDSRQEFNDWWGILNEMLADRDQPEASYGVASPLHREGLSPKKAVDRVIKDRAPEDMTIAA